MLPEGIKDITILDKQHTLECNQKPINKVYIDYQENVYILGYVHAWMYRYGFYINHQVFTSENVEIVVGEIAKMMEKNLKYCINNSEEPFALGGGSFERKLELNGFEDMKYMPIESLSYNAIHNKYLEIKEKGNLVLSDKPEYRKQGIMEKRQKIYEYLEYMTQMR